jgi:HEAT repeat protein
VPALVKALDDEAWLVRSAAASALGRIASEPEKTIPPLARAVREKGSISDEEHAHRPESAEALLELARKDDAEVRWRSLVALGRYVTGAGDRPIPKEETAKIAEGLGAALHDANGLVRDTAGDALADLGADVAVQVLSGPARHGSLPTRVSAILSLGRVAPQAGGDVCLRIWADALRSEPDEIWQAYADTWWRKAEAEMAGMDAWSKAKPDPGWPARAAAARALMPFGEKARPAIPVLVEALQDKAWLVRLAALDALKGIDPETKQSATAVGELLHDPERPVRRTAGLVLLKMGPELAVPACVSALQSKSVAVRTTAAEVLAEVGPQAKPALSALIRATDAWNLAPTGWSNGDHDMAILLLLARCCEAVAAVGPAGADAVPGLLDVMRKNASYCGGVSRLPLRPAFAKAFGSLGKDGAATQALTEALEDKDGNVRLCAVQSLGEVGLAAGSAVPRLVELMKAGEGGETVIHALGRIGAGAVAAVPLLTERLSAVHHRDREAAAEALGRIGPGAKEAVPALCKAVQDSVADVRWYALAALGQTGSESGEALKAIRRALHEDRHAYVRRAAVDALLRRSTAEVLPLLREGLSAQRWETRVACAGGLGELGGKAAPAVPDLRKALGDEDRDVRRAAAQALGKTGEPAKAAAPELQIALADFHQCVRRAAATALLAVGARLPEGYDPDKLVRK